METLQEGEYRIPEDLRAVIINPTTFLATSLNEEGEVITSLKRTLDNAKKWIDINLKN